MVVTRDAEVRCRDRIKLGESVYEPVGDFVDGLCIVSFHVSQCRFAHM